MESYQNFTCESIGERPVSSGEGLPCQGGFPPDVPDASLGTYYEITQPPLIINFQKVSRWSLLAASRDILLNDNRYQYRTCFCCRQVLIPKAGVDIFERLKKFRYSGLTTCGSVWMCPVCAVRVSEERRSELTLAIERNVMLGGSCQLWTFTAPHYMGQSLRFLLDAVSKARGKMLNRKSYKAQISFLGLRGTVRALEVTFSYDNGWHVHFHVLAFMFKAASEYDLEAIEDAFSIMWSKACLDVGLSAPSREHGVSVENGDRAAKYVGKWGVEDELTRWHVKKGKRKGLTPFDFLRAHVSGDFQYDDKFREYAKVFSGKRQLDWSFGLRGALNLGVVKTDSDIASELPAESVFFANIPSDAWRVILRYEYRGQVLQVCKFGLQALVSYVKEISGVDIEASMNPMVKAMYRGGVKSVSKQIE